MKHITRSGAALAAAAFSLAVTGAVFATAEAAGAKVHCAGINSCKGTSACATGSSACKGQNACKGQGWISVSLAKCSAKGGKVIG